MLAFREVAGRQVQTSERRSSSGGRCGNERRSTNEPRCTSERDRRSARVAVDGIGTATRLEWFGLGARPRSGADLRRWSVMGRSTGRRQGRTGFAGAVSCPASTWLPGADGRAAAASAGAEDGELAPSAVHSAREPSDWPKARRGLRSVFGVDLALLHAPAVFDFREHPAVLGPLADVVPSTDEFEMYPIGLTSLAGYLSRHAYNVRIVNLAYRMLRSPGFDVAAHLRRVKAPVFGIDLHWLPHVDGALAVAELVKRVHPDARVLLGGLSATYFHEELVQLPSVDFVLRGDSTEEPARQLLQALRSGRRLEDVENLTFCRPDGTVVVNPLTFVPRDLDYVDVPDYRYALRSVFKYRSLRDVVPYLTWLKQPTTMVLNARGCTFDCAICGGSRSAYRSVCARTRPAFRSPEKLVSDMSVIASFSGAPIFMVHDPRMGGIPRCRRLFELLGRSGIGNELVIELFFPAGAELFAQVSEATRSWSLEITIESADENLRRRNGKFACSNEAVEDTLASALAHGCGKLDLFFMVGIPHQTRASALATVDYCRHLAQRFGGDPRLQFYVAPLGPFLDPGSRAFEDPALGYHRRFTTLADHRRAMRSDDWREVLSFETESMTRDELVRTTYDVADGLNELKAEIGSIDAATAEQVRDHLSRSRRVLAALDEEASSSPARRRAVLDRMRSDVTAANSGSVAGTAELTWRPSEGIRVTRALLGGLAAAFVEEVPRSIARYRGRYDIGPLARQDVPPA